MSRGIRNNNPLNIRRSNDRWKGARMEQTDKSFVQFESMAYGYRAAWKVLENYWKHFRKERLPFTVQNIIQRWAPPNENDTDNYVRTVLKLTALGGMENLPRPFTGIAIEKLVRLLAGMTTMECGIPYKEANTDAIWEGYELAFPGKLRTEVPSSAEEYAHWDEYWDWSPLAYLPSEDE